MFCDWRNVWLCIMLSPCARFVSAIEASDCTYSDAAFTTLTDPLTATGSWTLLPKGTSGIRAGTHGISITAATGTQYVGILGTSAWVRSSSHHQRLNWNADSS